MSFSSSSLPSLEELCAALQSAAAQKNAVQLQHALQHIAQHFQHFVQRQQQPQLALSSSDAHCSLGFSPLFRALSCMVDCCCMMADIPIIHALCVELTNLWRLPAVASQLRELGAESTSSMFNSYSSTLLRHCRSALAAVLAYATEPGGARKRLTIRWKLTRFFVLHLCSFLSAFPDLLMPCVLETTRESQVALEAILAMPPSQQRHRLVLDHRTMLHPLVMSSLSSVLSSPAVPSAEQEQLCRALLDLSSADPAAHAVASVYLLSSLLMRAKSYTLAALDGLFQHVLPALLSALPLCWPHVADWNTAAASDEAEQQKDKAVPADVDLLDQCSRAIFALLSSLLTVPVEPELSQSSSPLLFFSPSVASSAHIELLMWRLLDPAHPLVVRVALLVWAQAMSGWDDAFRRRSLQTALQMIQLDEHEAADCPVTGGRLVLCDWLVSMAPLLQEDEQRELIDALDVASTLAWHAAQPPLALAPPPSVPAPLVPSPLSPSSSQPLARTQVLLNFQPARPSSPIPLAAAVHILSRLHVLALHPSTQSWLYHSLLPTLVHLLPQCLTPSTLASPPLPPLLTAQFQLLRSLLTSSASFDRVYATHEQRAAALQPIVQSVARLFSLPRQSPAAIDSQAVPPPLFPSFLALLSSSSSAPRRVLLVALLSFLDSMILHWMTLPPLLKLLHCLCQLAALYPFLRLLLPPVLERVCSSRLVQHPAAPVAAAPNQALMKQIIGLWHAVLASHPSTSSAASATLVSTCAIPRFWVCTTLLSSSPFAAHVPSLIPSTVQPALLSELAAYSERVSSATGAAQRDDSAQRERWELAMWQGARMQECAKEEHVVQAMDVQMGSPKEADASLASALAALESITKTREALAAMSAMSSHWPEAERQRLRAMLDAECELLMHTRL